MSQAPASRAPITDGPVTDVGHGTANQWSGPGDQFRLFDVRVAGGWADHHLALPLFDRCQVDCPPDIYQVGRVTQPQGQQRQEALPAGQHFGVVAMVG
jgi:hypothetical protein